MAASNGEATTIHTNAGMTDKDTHECAALSKPRATNYEKAIAYDRETRDYAMYLDSELVGFARTYHEAEVTLDQLVFELLSQQYIRDVEGGNDMKWQRTAVNWNS